MSKDKRHIPKASTLMGSLRSIGYSFEAAIADIIDNSISAHASNVHIFFPLNPLDIMAVGILDDGDGMDSIDAKMCVLPHATSKIKNEPHM